MVSTTTTKSAVFARVEWNLRKKLFMKGMFIFSQQLKYSNTHQGEVTLIIMTVQHTTTSHLLSFSFTITFHLFVNMFRNIFSFYNIYLYVLLPMYIFARYAYALVWIEHYIYIYTTVVPKVIPSILILL